MSPSVEYMDVPERASLILAALCFKRCLYKRVSNLQPADECECIYFLTAIGDLGELVLKKVDVKFEAIFCSYFDREEVMATPLGFLASSILLLAKGYTLRFCFDDYKPHEVIQY